MQVTCNPTCSGEHCLAVELGAVTVMSPLAALRRTSLACGERSTGVLASAAPALAAASAFIFFSRVRAAAEGT